MIELRWLGEFDKRLQYRVETPVWHLEDGTGMPSVEWGPWVDVPTVPADSDKLPDTD